MRNTKYDRYADGPGRWTAHGFIPMQPVKAAPKAGIVEWIITGVIIGFILYIAPVIVNAIVH